MKQPSIPSTAELWLAHQEILEDPDAFDVRWRHYSEKSVVLYIADHVIRTRDGTEDAAAEISFGVMVGIEIGLRIQEKRKLSSVGETETERALKCRVMKDKDVP